jgi:hypothetical protein
MIYHIISHKDGEMMSFEGKQMDLDIIMLSEISRIEKNKYCMFFLICGI